jgi:hypothetical protein
MELLEIRKILFEQLNPIFNSLGFILIDKGQDPRFIKKDSGKVIYCFFNFHRGGVSFSPISVSINSIEDIILEIGFPHNDLAIFKKKDKYYLETFHDKHTMIPNEKNSVVSIDNKSDIKELGDWVINYIQNTGLPFAEYYSHLPNVLSEMNRLEAEGKYWNGILGGLADYLFRGLIISKLCNDDDFERKVQYCDEKLNSRPSLAIWLPYYEKLKARLQNLQPMYNV